MQKRNIILALAGLVVLGGVALLLFEVKGNSDATVSDEKRARALAEYERRRAKTERASERVAPPSGDRAREQAERRRERARKAAEARERDEPRRELPGMPPRARLPQRSDGSRPSLMTDRAPEGADTDDPIKARMTDATKLYDKGNYPAAQEVALEVLEKSPRNIRMLRVAISTLCATGDVDEAGKYLSRLPKRDQNQMKRRCAKWGAELE